MVVLAFERGLDKVKVIQHSKYLGQRSFYAKVIVPTHTHTHTQRIACCIWTTKMIANNTTKYDTIWCIYVRSTADGRLSLIKRTT